MGSKNRFIGEKGVDPVALRSLQCPSANNKSAISVSTGTIPRWAGIVKQFGRVSFNQTL